MGGKAWAGVDMSNWNAREYFGTPGPGVKFFRERIERFPQTMELRERSYELLDAYEPWGVVTPT